MTIKTFPSIGERLPNSGKPETTAVGAASQTVRPLTFALSLPERGQVHGLPYALRLQAEGGRCFVLFQGTEQFMLNEILEALEGLGIISDLNDARWADHRERAGCGSPFTLVMPVDCAGLFERMVREAIPLNCCASVVVSIPCKTVDAAVLRLHGCSFEVAWLLFLIAAGQNTTLERINASWGSYRQFSQHTAL